MNTPNKKNIYHPLKWVKPELDNTIKSIQLSLQVYTDTLSSDPTDNTTNKAANKAPLDKISSDLYLLRGSLEMLAFYGVALLVEDMQNAVNALRDDRVSKKEDVFESLLQASISLSAYIDKLHQDNNDIPLSLLPAMNDIRASFNEPLLSESALFLPNLSIVPKTPGTLPENASETCLTENAISLRPYYQAALLTWFRDPTDTLSMQQMKLVARNLESSSLTPRNRQIWWIMGGLYEALIDKGLEASISLKLLLAQTDRILKTLSQNNDLHFEKSPPIDLLKNALYYISQSSSNGKRVASLKRIYRLDAIIPSEDALSTYRKELNAPDSDSLHAIAEELKKSLSKVKATIDNFARNTPDDTDKLTETIVPLKHISDTLSLLSMGNERKILQNLIEQISNIVSEATRPDRETLFKVASAMLHIESTLKNFATYNQQNRSEYRSEYRSKNRAETSNTPSIHDVSFVNIDPMRSERLSENEYNLLIVKTAEEAKQNILDIKNNVLSHLSSNDKQNGSIKHVPGLLSEIIGSMIMLNINSLPIILKALSEYVCNNLISEKENATKASTEKNLDTFAEIIVSIEYYLETMAEEKQACTSILDVTCAKLEELGYPVTLSKDETKLNTENDTSVTNISETFTPPKYSTTPATVLSLVEDSTLTEQTEAKKENSAQSTSNILTFSSKEPDTEVREIFITEAYESLEKMNAHIKSLKLSPGDTNTLSAIQNIYQTLKGNGKVSGATQTSDIATAADDYIARVLHKSIIIEKQGVAFLTDTLQLLNDSIDRFQTRNPDNTSVQEFQNRAAELIDEQTQATTEKNKKHEPKPTKQFDLLDEKALTNSADKLNESHADKTENDITTHAISDTVKETTSNTFNTTTLSLEPIPKEDMNNSNGSKGEGETENRDEAKEQKTSPSQETEANTTHTDDPEADDDFDLIDIFIEEALELIEKGNQEISATKEIDNAFLAPMQRLLHTIKGSARMAGVTPVGSLAHTLESVFEAITTKQIPHPESILQLTQETLDAINDMIEDIQRGSDLRTFNVLLSKLESVANNDASHKNSEQDTLAALPEAADNNESKQKDEQINKGESTKTSEAELDQPKKDTETTLTTALAQTKPAQKPQEKNTVKTRNTCDTIKVDPEVLNKLVDFSTEESAISNRIGDHVTSTKTNLLELDEAISRTLTQMRDLQFESNNSRTTKNRYDDNLNLTTFSETQKVAQRLMESIADIESLHSALMRLTLETDNLVHQQKKIQNQLHENLLSARMVTFSVQTQRMQRILRQTCNELNKKAKLKLEGTAGSIDRSILDAIMGPMEHIIRNAIAHGIEAPRERTKKNKNKQGTVSISFGKERAEHLIVISDDGSGLDLDSIRKKALDKNLISESKTYSDDEIANLIFEPGLSTNDKISQIAGRGIGMDVVLTTLHELGGSVSISTEKDKGSTFTLRMPFTLSRNHTLLIKSGNNTYAVPSSFVENTVHVSRDELQTLYKMKSPSYPFNEHLYPLWNIDTLLNDSVATLPSDSGQASIILIKYGQKRMALHVDSITEERDVVLKPNSAQLGNVSGISGATVMGDGKVILIIDVPTLTKIADNPEKARDDVTLADNIKGKKRNSAITAMVVDDSITVRKVTERFLSRNNINSLLASDGIDALKILEEALPDIFLVDIEMPGMDGLALAKKIKSTARLQQIPIIMITSRTGKQHRNAASQIGVDLFIGKPYRESELIRHIHALTGNESADAHI